MERLELVDKLNLLKTSLAKQDIVPILSHFCFRDNQIIAFDGIQASVLDFNSDLNCALPGDLFLKLLNSFSSNQISMQLKDNQVLLKSGSSS
jgi:DNA polymerase III sliding clamp (beta) subunit (PCNA family)